ncbi:hypothetical protein Q3G72_001553 [Acer saccharum]|nr:hypothetical protein Q3G72_001553 [Acer saccharum]
MSRYTLFQSRSKSRTPKSPSTRRQRSQGPKDPATTLSRYLATQRILLPRSSKMRCKVHDLYWLDSIAKHSIFVLVVLRMFLEEKKLKSFLVFVVHEGVTVPNLKTDSNSEFGCSNTAEERERCAREARLADGQTWKPRAGHMAHTASMAFWPRVPHAVPTGL